MNKIKGLYDHNTIVRSIINLFSILTALLLLGGAFFSIAIASCHSGGGFCASDFNAEGIYSAGFLIALAGPFLVFPFSNKIKSLLFGLLLASAAGLFVVCISYITISP